MSAFGGAFGQPSSGFGAPSNSGFGAQGTFGQSSQSAFGSSAFGAPSGGLFGASAQQQHNSAFGSFGQSSAPFGSSSVFGASATQSAPAFGAAGAFGSSVFGGQSTSGFGASGVFGASQSAFGSGGGAFGGGGGGTSLFGNNQSTGGGFGASGSAFGQSQSAWGAGSSNLFGNSFGSSGAGGIFGGAGSGSSLFGNQGNSGFGANNQNQKGTAGTPWQITTEYEGNTSSGSKYHAITMMSAYRDKSIEELRLEDYALGNKGGSNPTGGNGLFGQPAPSTGLFGSGVSGSAFGNTGGFGASSSGFGQQSGGFGAPSGGGLFGSNTGFGNTGGGFGQSGSSGFGNSGGGFGQTGGGLFGQQSGGGFGQSSGAFGATNTFGSSAFGSGSNAFGSSGGGFGSGGTGFGSGGGFGSTGGGFGGGSNAFGSGGGFGGSGFGANNQSGGNNLFGQSGPTNGFGAPQSQSAPFGNTNQSGGGLFGSAAPTGSNAFGNPQSASNLFGGAGQQNNLFGGGSSFAPSMGSNPIGQKPLFGSSAPATGFGISTGGSGGLFGGGVGVGQSAPSTGFGFGGGFGGGFGSQPTQLQNPQPSPFGAAGGQVAPNVPPPGQNPSVTNTFNAVTQGNGGTVAPPGANYGTVLHNLQLLQGEMDKQKKMLEQQAQASANNVQQGNAVSVVVLPTPPLVKLSTGRATGEYSWASRTAHRTKMRSVVGKLGGATQRVSGTALRLPGPSPQSEPALASAQAAVTPLVRKMPFFSPQQFTASRRRSLLPSSANTPSRVIRNLLPVPDTLTKDARGRLDILRDGSDDNRKASFSSPIQTPATGKPASREEQAIPVTGTGNEEADEVNLSDRDVNNDEANSKVPPRGFVEDNDDRRDSTLNGTAEEFMWSAKRPSTWSLKRPVDAAEQYNPADYLPYLTKDGFYTIPSSSELASKTMKELQSVEGFTVGREGFGEIKWIEPVDVRGLDLNIAVDIQRGEVAVFPERDAYQLDARARVTLKGMYKKDKKTGKVTQDKAQVAKYAAKLEVYCENNDLRFLEYDADEGEWVFEVSAFSED